MGTWFLSATHQQVKAECALGILFLVILFWPTIRWMPQMLTRVNPVRAGQVEVEVPRGWVVRKETSRVQAAKPCLTVLCSYPSGSIAVGTVDEPDLDEAIWRKSAESVLQKFDFPQPRLREIAGDSGISKCLEARRNEASGETMSTCLNPKSEILATFRGGTADLEVFYRVVASARLIENPAK